MTPERLEELAGQHEVFQGWTPEARADAAAALRDYAKVVRVFADSYPYMERNEDGYVAGALLRDLGERFSDHHPTPLAAILDLADRLEASA